MADVETLHDLYIDELRDSWSANDQMLKALKKIAPRATHDDVKAMLEKTIEGIPENNEVLKGLIEAHDEKVKKEHCKGMEGLAAEALKHTVEEGPEKGPVLDAAIIAQYQRMTHYGITGFGTAAAFATALKHSKDATELRKLTKKMYDADALMTKVAEAAVNVDAVDG